MNFLSTEPSSTQKPSSVKNTSIQSQGYKLNNRYKNGVAYHNRPSFARISEEQAMKIPAVSASANLISSAISKLHIYLYIRDDECDSVNVDDDYRFYLLNGEALQTQSTSSIMKRIVTDSLLQGVSYD